MSRSPRMLVLAFKGTVAARAAQALTVPCDKQYLLSQRAWLEGFVARTNFAAYDYVLALGMYSGRDHQALRIETTCSNQFRNNKQTLHRCAIPYFLQPQPPLKLANGIGNSWCNLLSYAICTGAPECRYTFVHIPKTFDALAAAEALQKQLATL